MLNISSPVVSHNADPLSRQERLNDGWIAACAGYLRTVFGDRLAGRTVVDYGFGKGNWSLAFLRAGAGRVIAVNAGQSDAPRLAEYCDDYAIDNIEIVPGNVLEGPVEAAGDIVWLYDVLHQIEFPDPFVERIAAMAPGAEALFYIYAYDRHSPREFVVETCRELAGYRTEDEFRRDAPYLTRPARLRARADLAAPHIAWYSTCELSALLARHGLAPKSRYRGFEAHLSGIVQEEFVPHQWLCGRGVPGAIEVLDPPRRHAADLRILEDMAEAVAAIDLGPEERRAVALGLFNTHFSALATDGGTDAAVVEDFLYLFYVLTSHDGRTVGDAGAYVDLTFAAMDGRACDDLPAAREATVLARQLRERRVKI